MSTRLLLKTSNIHYYHELYYVPPVLYVSWNKTQDCLFDPPNIDTAKVMYKSCIMTVELFGHNKNLRGIGQVNSYTKQRRYSLCFKYHHLWTVPCPFHTSIRQHPPPPENRLQDKFIMPFTIFLFPTCRSENS